MKIHLYAAIGRISYRGTFDCPLALQACAYRLACDGRVDDLHGIIDGVTVFRWANCNSSNGRIETMKQQLASPDLLLADKIVASLVIDSCGKRSKDGRLADWSGFTATIRVAKVIAEQRSTVFRGQVFVEIATVQTKGTKP